MESHEAAFQQFYSRDAQGNLVFCGTPVIKPLRFLTRGEPAYIIGTEIIQFQVQAAREALKASNTRSTYAIKANSSPAVLRIIRDQGIGAEVASEQELRLALDEGFKPEDIVVDGIGKTREYFALALDANIPVINCNDLGELRLLNEVAEEKHKRPRVGLRVSPNIPNAGETPQTTTVGYESKFGVTLEDAEKAYLSGDYPHLNLVGIHCHMGSNVSDKNKFELGYDAVVSLVEKLHKAGHSMEYVDFGGGIGVPYSPYGALDLTPSADDKALITIQEYGDILQRQRERLKAINPDMEFISEFGRYYVAPAMLYVCKVTGENEKQGHTHIITNGNMGQLIRTAFYQSPHIAFPMKARAHGETYGPNTQLVGNMCESGDIIARDCKGMQRQRTGDYVCIPAAGAYNPSMLMPMYNQHGSCSTILVHTDGRSYLEPPISGTEYTLMKAASAALPPDLQKKPQGRQWLPHARPLTRIYDPSQPENLLG